MNLTGLFVNSLSLTEKWGKHELVKFNSNVSPLIARIKEATLNYPYTKIVLKLFFERKKKARSICQ